VKGKETSMKNMRLQGFILFDFTDVPWPLKRVKRQILSQKDSKPVLHSFLQRPCGFITENRSHEYVVCFMFCSMPIGIQAGLLEKPKEALIAPWQAVGFMRIN
jgi:hypothetical protein